MPIDTSVKFIHSGMVGSSQIALSAGSLLTILRACLINGIAGPAITNIIISNGIATVNCSTAHPFMADVVSLIAGSPVTVINGEKKVLSTVGNSYTFDATGVADQTITGTITHKVAPLGWSEAFTGTSTLAVFRSLDPSSSKAYLRVDDSLTTDARVICYKTMIGLNDGDRSNRSPSRFQLSGGLFWNKYYTSSSTPAPPWMIWGNNKVFYIYIYNHYPSGSHTYGFGDLVSCLVGGPPVAFISGSTSTLNTSSYDSVASINPNAPSNIYLLNGALEPFKSVQCYSTLAFMSSNLSSSGDGTSFTSTYSVDLANSSRKLSNILIIENNCYRGYLPGIYFCLNNLKTTLNLAMRDAMSSGHTYYGKTMRAVQESNGGTSVNSIFFFDSTGPW